MIRKYLDKLVVTYPMFLEFIRWLISFKAISYNRFYQKCTLRKALNYTAKYQNSDLIVRIENTISCNARCIMCLHRNNKMTGLMPMPLYKKVINECVKNSIKTVNFGIYGEALTDPDFIERIGYLRNRNLEYTMLSNGSLLNDELAEKLFQLGGLKQIHFSINGFSKEVYEKVMDGLDRDRTYENVINFLRLKKTFNRKDLIVLLSCVKTKYVLKEKGKLIAFWKKQEGVNRIFFYDIIDKFKNLINEDWIGNPSVLDKDDLWFGPCNQLWEALTVYYDGRVAPCSADNDERVLIVGDLTNQPLNEILSGKPYTDLRKMHRENRRKEHIVCSRCHSPSSWFMHKL